MCKTAEKFGKMVVGQDRNNKKSSGNAYSLILMGHFQVRPTFMISSTVVKG